MGCFHRCIHCLSLVPWASLIATVICWSGTALFCGAGHEALTLTPALLNSSSIPGFLEEEFPAQNVMQGFKYAIYGIAGYMLLLSLLLFVDGILATRTVKRDFDDGCKSSTCGICMGIFYTIISSLTHVGWLLMTCFAALPLSFLVMAQYQCYFIGENTDDCSQPGCPSVCVDFVQTGVIRPNINTTVSNYGRLCGNELVDFCKSNQFSITYQLYLIAFIGSAVVVLSVNYFLMSLSANYAYVKMARKLAVYEDAKYREEMELNDIINTARSNERLTH